MGPKENYLDRYEHHKTTPNWLCPGYALTIVFESTFTESKPAEHFSSPLHFACKYFGLSSTLIPFASGTGHMITSLQSNEIDIGIGLTEGWIAGLGKATAANKDAGYKLVGIYVETPLCWAISTGANREDIRGVEDLKGKKMGVSRIGRYAPI